MKRISLLPLVTMLLLSCRTFSSTPTPNPPLLTTGETPNPLPEPTDPTQLLVVRSGETFDIVLPFNSSTGYRWQLTRELDVNLVQAMGQTYNAEQPVIPGSGSVEVWTFSDLTPGEKMIEFGYYPPGTGTVPEETVIFSIASNSVPGKWESTCT